MRDLPPKEHNPSLHDRWNYIPALDQERIEALPSVQDALYAYPTHRHATSSYTVSPNAAALHFVRRNLRPNGLRQPERTRTASEKIGTRRQNRSQLTLTLFLRGNDCTVSTTG